MLDTTTIAPSGPSAERSAPSGRRISVRNKKRPPTPASTEPPPQYQSDDLLAGGEEALILHRDEVYRLRRTWTGKLILTK